MSMEAILAAIEGHLRPRAEGLGGRVFLAEGPDEVESKFGQSAGGWSLIMCWEGYKRFEDQPIPNSGLQFAEVIVIIERNRGMKLRRGADIATFSQLVDRVIGWLRAVQLSDRDGNTDLHGMELVDTDWLAAEDPWRRHRLLLRVPVAVPMDAPVILPIG